MLVGHESGLGHLERWGGGKRWTRGKPYWGVVVEKWVESKIGGKRVGEKNGRALLKTEIFV